MTPQRRAARTLAATALSLGAALGAGCASGAFDSDQPYQQVYVLAGLPPAPAARALVPFDVAVTRPQVRPGLDTDRIAVLYPDRRLDYFAASRWGGDTDAVVQSLLVESLRNGAGLRSVQGDGSAFAAEYVVQTEVTDFQAEYESAGGIPVAHVQYIVTVGRYADRRSLTSFVAAARVPAQSNSLRAVVAAFQQASRDAALIVVENIRAALQSLPPAAVPETSPASVPPQ